ncbi:hypothetical protein Esti_003270 [Eimeria stiedai]
MRDPAIFSNALSFPSIGGPPRGLPLPLHSLLLLLLHQSVYLAVKGPLGETLQAFSKQRPSFEGFSIFHARCRGILVEGGRHRWSLRSVHAAAATLEAAAAGSAIASVEALLPLNAARGQQQALHSLLQEIESYSSSTTTKLSLKVYHLQQLASVPGSSYLLLQQHPGVARLVKDLTAATAAAPAAAPAAAAGQELSPQQLHALALCCCKLRLPSNHPLWNGLAKQMLRHSKGGGLSVSEASSSLRAFAAASAAVDLTHIAALLQHVLRDVGRLNEHDVACLLFAVRKYRLNPLAEAQQQIQVLSEENPGGAPWGAPRGPPLASLGQAAIIGTTRNKQLKGNSKKKGDCSKKSSSNSSRLSKLSLKVVRVCAWVLQQRAAAVTPKSLVCCLYEFGQLQLLPWRLLLLLRRRLRQQQQLQQLDGRGLALLALSLSLLQQREPKIVKRIGAVLHQHLQQMYIHAKNRRQEQHLLVANHSLCLILHAIAQLNIREQLVLEAACQRIETEYFHQPPARHVQSCFGEAGGEALTGLALNQHHCQSEGRNAAAAARGAAAVVLPAAVAAAAAVGAAAQRASQLSPLDLTLCLVGASKAGAAEPTAVGALVAQALKLERGFTGQQLANLLDGLALSGYIKEHAEACLRLLEVYIQLGEEGPQCRENQLRRVAFTLLMEVPQKIVNCPRSLQLFIESKQQPFHTLESRAYHQSLGKTLRLLGGFEAGGPDNVGPYKVDARVNAKKVDAALPRLLQQKVPDGSSSSSSKTRSISADVCLDLLSEGCYCPLSGSLLGAAQLKQRQLQELGFLYCSVRRQQWLRASAEVQRQMLLRALLVATGEQDKAELAWCQPERGVRRDCCCETQQFN